MLKVIEKDLLEIDEGLIVHQVNCRGTMGSGVAGQLKLKYPQIYKKYIELYNQFIDSGETIKLLGTFQIVPINAKLKIVNAFTQFNFGYDGKLYTEYSAIEEVFKTLKIINYKKLPVYIPYRYGSNLGGGDFNIVSEIIEDEYPEVIICRRKGD